MLEAKHVHGNFNEVYAGERLTHLVVSWKKIVQDKKLIFQLKIG